MIQLPYVIYMFMAILYHTCTHLETIILSMHHGYTLPWLHKSIQSWHVFKYFNYFKYHGNQTKYFICTISVQPFHFRTKKTVTIKLTVYPITSTLVLFNTCCSASVDIIFQSRTEKLNFGHFNVTRHWNRLVSQRHGPVPYDTLPSTRLTLLQVWHLLLRVRH